MVKLQIDLSGEENKIVEMYKAIYNIETKELTVKDMIQRFHLKDANMEVRPRLKR